MQNKGEVGTVGAVAIDANGHVASATSTGGINGKMVGRSSDTSQVGSGGYADDYVGAVSTTGNEPAHLSQCYFHLQLFLGHGESITKFCLAHAIIGRMAAGLSARDATEQTLKDMTKRLNNTAGVLSNIITVLKNILIYINEIHIRADIHKFLLSRNGCL